LGGRRNSSQNANLFFDDSKHKPANLCGQTFNTTALLQTGYKGKPDTESVLSRVYCLSDALADVGAAATISVTMSGGSRSKTDIKTTSLNGSWFDIDKQGQWFYSQASFPASLGV